MNIRVMTIMCLFSVVACSAIAATSATAAEFLLAEWLINGAAVTTELVDLHELEFLFKLIPPEFHVICSGHTTGTVGPNGQEATTKFLDLSGKVVELGGEALLCSSAGGCESTGDIEAWPEKLPWKEELVLEAPSEKFFVLVTGVAFTVKCLVLGIAVSQECGLAEKAAVEVANVVGGVEEKGVATPRGTCGSDEIEYEPLAGNAIVSTEGTVSVSE